MVSFFSFPFLFLTHFPLYGPTLSFFLPLMNTANKFLSCSRRCEEVVRTRPGFILRSTEICPSFSSFSPQRRTDHEDHLLNAILFPFYPPQNSPPFLPFPSIEKHCRLASLRHSRSGTPHPPLPGASRPPLSLFLLGRNAMRCPHRHHLWQYRPEHSTLPSSLPVGKTLSPPSLAIPTQARLIPFFFSPEEKGTSPPLPPPLFLENRKHSCFTGYASWNAVWRTEWFFQEPRAGAPSPPFLFFFFFSLPKSP